MSQPNHISTLKGGMWRGLTGTITSDNSYFGSAVESSQPETRISSSTTRLIIPACGGGVELYPFGTGEDDDDFGMRVSLWRNIGSLWFPLVVGTSTCTLSATLNGVAGSPIAATELFADTIVDAGSTWDTNLISARSYANNQLASLRVSTIGFDLIGVEWDIAGGGQPSDDVNVAYAYF